MEHQNVIFEKLEQFINKYYKNELLRGTIFFVGIGLLYFLFTLFVEYFLWLKPAARTFLFWTFIIVEFFLLLRFIFFPIFKLFKLKGGINHEEASIIIGNHFNEVADKLTNFLQLTQDSNQSELLLASIQQKSVALQPIPFSNAIKFNSNKKYLPIAIIPVLFFLFFYISGNSDFISQSFNRVINYKQQFLPPAPFEFQMINTNLQTEQNQDFTVKVKTVGSVIPENTMIIIGDESYFMQPISPGLFQFVIPKPKSNLEFHFEANQIESIDYLLKVVTVPSISNFEMVLSFPKYLNRKSETVKGTGNAVVPEGTAVTWRISALATQKVKWLGSGASLVFFEKNNLFFLSKSIIQNTDYQIVTSNSKVLDYEKLNYQISVIKDQYPSLVVGNAPDSLKIDKNFLLGQASDDYGISKLYVVYYPKDKPSAAKRSQLNIKNDVYDQFIFSFPGNLTVEEGVVYDYYFQLYDNDAMHNFKSVKSTVFSNRISTESEKEDRILQQQNDNINSLQKTLKIQDKQLNEMEKLQKIGKEKENLDFKEQQKVNDFLNKQKQQDELMKNFAEKMKENLDKFKSEKKDEIKEVLKKRLDKVDSELEKNKKLLEELQKLNEKLQKEELFDKMEKLKQQTKNQTKSLQQLVELTKKYYVEKKAEQIAEKLEKLSEKQEQLSDNEKENSSKEQEDINQQFNKIQEELKELQIENKQLKTPLELPETAPKEKSIEEDLNKATDDLKKQSKSSAKPKQKSAAKKMKQMSGEMQSSMEAGDMEQMEEDAAMLRQILDNLLAYSFSQETIIKDFKGLKRGSPSFNKNLKIQQDIKQQFKHVDDSLFALSLRNPKIAEEITTEVGNVQFNIDKSLETLSDANVPKGVSHQQFAISAANKLADMLSFTLNSMQMSMSGSGKGKPKPGQGSGMQLPDIIKKQDGLAEKLKKGMKPGQKPGEGKDGSDGKDGNSPKSGKGNKIGSSDSNNGNQGDDGEGDAKEIIEIYKEQQQLRDALQNELNKQGMGGVGQNALNQMKQIEKQLLNKGFDNQVLQNVLNVKYEMLKLDKAIQQQGEEKKRQSETNKKEFNNPSTPLPSRLQEYINSIEILNRQTLPLRSNFNQKVQQYFRTNDKL